MTENARQKCDACFDAVDVTVECGPSVRLCLKCEGQGRLEEVMALQSSADTQRFNFIDGKAHARR